MHDPGPSVRPAIRLAPVDLAAPDEASVADVAAVREPLRRESQPHDAPAGVDATRRRLAAIAQVREMAVELVVARMDDAVVGLGAAIAPIAGDNAHLLQVDVAVVPRARRHGVGRALAAWTLDVAHRRGRRLIIGADGLVARWLADGPTRAPGYAIEELPHPLPAAVLEPFAALQRSMNDAPHGTLDVEDRVYTPAALRDLEAASAARGDVAWTLLARRQRDGAYAGVTDLYWNAGNPRVAQQGDTAVAPEHRGHALGKWLKAAMLERLHRERPEVRVVRTGNADTNAAMLAINEALGFAVAREAIVWQVATEELERRLAGAAAERA